MPKKIEREERRRGMHRYNEERKREAWTEEERTTRQQLYERMRPYLERFIDEEDSRRKTDEVDRRRKSTDLAYVFREM